MFKQHFKREGGNCSLLGDPGCDHGDLVQQNSRTELSVEGAFVGAVGGAGLGHLLGKALGRWETVEFDNLGAGDGTVSMHLHLRP